MPYYIHIGYHIRVFCQIVIPILVGTFGGATDDVMKKKNPVYLGWW